MTSVGYVAVLAALGVLASFLVSVFVGRAIRRSYPPDHPTSDERWGDQP